MLQTAGLLSYNHKHMGNPCTTKIDDKGFLKHMILHHQVAIDMSNILLKYSKNPDLIFLARNIIYGQTDEILQMENMLLSHIPNLASSSPYRTTIIPTTYEVYCRCLTEDKNAKCGLHFFDPEHNHIEPNAVLTDDTYLQHMIEHHQVAVDMSKNLLNHTNNPMLTSFAYGIILNQEHEIGTMKQMLTGYKYYSTIMK